nr:MAG TPA: L protein, polymerase, putative cap-binding, viral [Caudoviricetes sp.]
MVHGKPCFLFEKFYEESIRVKNQRQAIKEDY